MAKVVVLTNVGRELENNRLKGLAGNPEPVYIGWGTGTGTANRSSTGLQLELPESRVEGTSSVETTDTQGDTYRVNGTIYATGNRIVREAATYNAASGGVAHLLASFDPIELESGEYIEFTFERQLM